MAFIWSQKLQINIIVYWSLSDIMTSILIIRESESPQPFGLVDSDLTNDEFLGFYSIHNSRYGS